MEYKCRALLSRLVAKGEKGQVVAKMFSTVNAICPGDQA